MNSRPRIRSIGTDLASGPWTVVFDHATARVEAQHVNGVRVFRWILRGPGVDAAGESIHFRHALLEMACRAARPPAGLELSELELARLARDAESSVDAAVKIVRDLLRRRTGRRWSVRRGKDSRRDDITIMSMPDDRRGRSMTFDDTVTLASLTGGGVVTPSAGYTIVHEPGRGRRAAIVRMLAGPAVQAGGAACG